MFCSLSHEEEGQSVAGKVEEPLSLPGGADLRVRGEGCFREVRREDGPNPVYVPHELGVLALHSLGCVEGSEHVRPLPYAHGASASQQEHCRVVPVGKRFGKRGEAFEQAFRKESVKLPTDGHVREGRRSLPQCCPLFKLDKNRGTKLVEPTPKKLIATAVSLLEGADVFRQPEKRRLVKAGRSWGNRGLSRGDGVDGTDTDGKQELAGVWHEPGRKLLIFGNPEVTVELRPYLGAGLL